MSKKKLNSNQIIAIISKNNYIYGRHKNKSIKFVHLIYFVLSTYLIKSGCVSIIRKYILNINNISSLVYILCCVYLPDFVLRIQRKILFNLVLAMVYLGGVSNEDLVTKQNRQRNST